MRAEYSIFILFMKFMTKTNLEYSEGNAFAQVVQDCATLGNSKKHAAVGVCFIDPKLNTNHTVCLSMVLTGPHRRQGRRARGQGPRGDP